MPAKIDRTAITQPNAFTEAMPQTLLAIAAMMVATLFAYQQQQNVIQTRMQMMRNEVETGATGVAVDRLEEIRIMAYDEATKGETKISSPGSLTPAPDFKLDSPADDIDDFDDSYVKRFREYAGDTLWYGVQSVVRYADESNPDDTMPATHPPTKFKKATVRVYSLTMAKTDTITISQSFSCGSKCDW